MGWFGGLSVLGAILIAAGGAIWLSGGFATELLGIRVRATDPLRPIAIGTALLAIRWLLAKRAGFAFESRLLAWIGRPPLIAAVLAIVTTATALTTNYGVAAGSDSYGYVSQADLWIAGDLTVEYDWIRDAPWPKAQLSASPLGYRPSPSGESSVPTYAPGLPLLLAGAKLLFGPCGSVIAIALMAGSLVGLTYLIGRRVASPQIGAGAALLVATCPVVLFMMAMPMSDVPAAGLSAAALLGCLQRTRIGALLGGLAMAAVILTRPNLAPLAALPALWLVAVDRWAVGWSMRLARSALFIAGVMPGAIVLALFNASLYESAVTSGYGNIEGFFSASHILPNLRNYIVWLSSVQTPLIVIGVAALFLPVRWIRKRESLTDARLLALTAAGVTALYLPYTVYGAWWFLRFLLPAWPAFAIGTAWLVSRADGRTFSWRGVASLVAVAVWGIGYASTHDAFKVGWGDLRYVSAAHAVREMTPEGSVILSMQHSGSVNYYAGRHALRYDWIDPHRLESVIGWLKERGHGVYILLEDWEVSGFRARFQEVPYGGLPEDTLLFRQQAGTPVMLFDTRSHPGERPRVIPEFLPSAGRCCGPERR